MSVGVVALLYVGIACSVRSTTPDLWKGGTSFEWRPSSTGRALGPQLAFMGPSGAAGASIQELFTSNLRGTDRRERTHDGHTRFLPHFSPDGRRIVYTKYLQGNYGSAGAVTAVGVYDLANARETLLTNDGVAVQPVWSPDGRRIAYGNLSGDGIWIMNADGSGAHRIARPAQTPGDMWWGDYLWSSDNWLYFSVAQKIDGCFKVRIDRMRPDGSGRAKIDQGGPNCTPNGLQQSGDADPGISPDGKTLYSSRGLPQTVRGAPTVTIRHLYAFSSAPFYPGKIETDLSAKTKPNCVVGVPKVSPGGTEILVFLFCLNDRQHIGITATDPRGKRWTFIEPGFGADWNLSIPSPSFRS